MPIEIENVDGDRTQRNYARLAGFLFIGLIVIALGSGFILSHVAGSGTFADIATRMAASERLYRVALCAVVIVSLSSVVLAFALYATLKPVNGLLAQLAMIFCLADSFLAMVVRMSSFVRLQLYLSARSAEDGMMGARQFVDLMRSVAGATENLGGICFGIGLLIFFYLFLKSRYIPRVLAALGVASSAVWAILYLANLVFPQDHSIFQSICFPPMVLADVATGFYLILFAVKTKVPGNEL